MNVAKGTLLAIGAVILVVVLSIAAWQLNWFVTEKNTNRQASINRHSFDVQQTYHEEVISDFANIKAIDVQLAGKLDDSEKTALQNQRQALVNQTCDQIGRLFGGAKTADIQQFETTYCTIP